VTLPNLLIAGFPKAGTGSLFSYLVQHPDVCGATRKEVGFFTHESTDGMRGPLERYEAYFPCGDARVVVEATPKYVYGGTVVIDAIRRALPGVHVILIVREPFDRLWSAFTFQRSLGHLGPGSFEAYVEACMQTRNAQPDIHDQGHHKGLSIGMYGDHVPPWLEAFGRSVRVVFFDDLAARPADLVATLGEWLGLRSDALESIAYDRKNATIHPRSLAAARVAALARGVARRYVDTGTRRSVKGVYQRFNSTDAPPRPPEATVRAVRGLYRASNESLLRALTAAGYERERLPGWLVADDQPAERA